MRLFAELYIDNESMNGQLATIDETHRLAYRAIFIYVEVRCDRGNSLLSLNYHKNNPKLTLVLKTFFVNLTFALIVAAKSLYRTN